MGQKVKKIAVLFTLFILPALLFYLMVYTGVHKVNRLHFYGPRTVTETQRRGATVYDTTYHSIPAFAAADINGVPFSSKTVEGKIYLAHFIDMSQLQDIPKEVTYLAAETLPLYPSVEFVSFLEKMPAGLKIDLPSVKTSKLSNCDVRWHYVNTTDSLATYLKKEGYFKKDPQDTLNTDPGSVVLVDMEGHIRGYYNPVLQSDASNLKKEISMLYKEYELAFKTHKYIDFN
ncbi:MAG: hypothetical protein ACT6QS_01820 [Flavobacteriales bacterium]